MFAGLRALCSRLWLSYSGQRLLSAPAWYQDFQERSTSRYAYRQDERAYQEDYHAGAEGAVWHEERLRCVARGVAGTTAHAVQVPVSTMESSAILPVVCIVVVDFHYSETDHSDTQRANATIRLRLPRPCSCALPAIRSWMGPEKNSLRFIKDIFLPLITPTQRCRKNIRIIA